MTGATDPRGTDGYATITSPGNDPLAITVGAMKRVPTSIDHVVKPDLGRSRQPDYLAGGL